LNSLCRFFSLHDDSLILLPGVIVGHLNPDIASIFASTLEWMPVVILASSRDDQVLQVDPSLSNQVCLSIVVEDGDF
jgi:hypothetical protein